MSWFFSRTNCATLTRARPQVTTEKPTSSQMTALSTDSRGDASRLMRGSSYVLLKLAKFEIDRHADPACQGHIALLGGNEAPALDRCQRGSVQGVAAAALLDLDLPWLAAGQHFDA
ncbi:hypothetical protein D9M71_797490 [compost metagenome]